MLAKNTNTDMHNSERLTLIMIARFLIDACSFSRKHIAADICRRKGPKLKQNPRLLV
jgi:hypothetical protein